ncbi:MAG: DNA repair protein RecN, partial [Clostridiales bacterium]|nr:DNA repair protein RecN [Clostridiales bacterium]
MLSALHIENIAVIERVDLTFESGFNVLTGETGAGKSIIIDSIQAILGERTSRDVIRTGSERASVSAQFTDLPDKIWEYLSQNSFLPEEEKTLIMRRDLYTDGRNVCRINGVPVTVAQLKVVGRMLIDIHGQHDGQKLLDDTCHIEYLDRYCKNEELIESYQKEYELLRSIREQISQLLIDQAEKERKIEMLTFQIDELKSAELKEGEEEQLTERRDLLRNAERLLAGIDCAYALLYGDENTSGVCTALKNAGDVLIGLSSLGPKFREFYEKTEELKYQTEDLVRDLGSVRESIGSSEGELEAVEERLDLIYRLKRKYGSTILEMLAFLKKSEAELVSIATADEKIALLKEKYKAVKERTIKLANNLHEEREKGAEDLKNRIVSELRSLDMPNAVFGIPVEPDKTEKGSLILHEYGADQVRFLISTNIGETPRNLSKVASGGELSRVMLALKNVLVTSDPVHTLIFDEVDAGVSGRAANKIAVKLKEVSKNKQVLCVTHLAQIAAFADAHYLIAKTEKDKRTYTNVSLLTFEERKRELARIIGGEIVTETTLKSAEELINAA